MRAVLFFLNLCWIVLCGGHAIYAETHHNPVSHTSAYTLTENKSSQFLGKELNNTIIEDTDLDIEEEYVSAHKSVKEDSKYKIFTTKGNLPKRWYDTFTSSFILQYYDSKSCKTSTPILGDSSPIYIKNRVLRI